MGGKNTKDIDRNIKYGDFVFVEANLTKDKIFEFLYIFNLYYTWRYVKWVGGLNL